MKIKLIYFVIYLPEMDYTDSIMLLKRMRDDKNEKQSIWRSISLTNRAKKVTKQAELTRHFCRGFDTDTAEGMFDIIVSHFLE